ncbi:MAG: thioredoxin domain-containing protein [Opitutales bacterium]
MKTRPRTLPILTALLGLLLACQGLVAGEAPERIAAYFYADWCNSCKELDPKVEAARAELAPDTRTLFVTFDLTDERTRAQAAMLAGALGLGSVYETHASKTGFMVVLDADDNSVLHKVTKTDEVATIRNRFASR